MSSNRFLQQALSRRGLLKNVALMALLAPVLRRQEAWAAPGAAPRRVIFVYTPNGPTRVVGPASGTETNFTIHPWWKELERHKADSIFLSHMAWTGAGTVPNDTGDGLGPGNQMFSGFGSGKNYVQRGATIDQLIGKRLEMTKQAGVQRSVFWGNRTVRGVDNAFGPGGGNPEPISNPGNAWTDLFAKFSGTTTGPEEIKRAEALLARNKSVLDFVNKDCAALKSALGAEGASMLDDHCTTLRSMESNLVKVLPNSCSKPAQPGANSGDDVGAYDAQWKAFIDLTGASLACELTRVVALQLGGGGHSRNRLPTGYGVPSAPANPDVGDEGPDHHGWTHQGNRADTLKGLEIFTNFYAKQVGLLVDKLKATKDSSGASLFDSTVVVWASEHGGHPNMGNDPHVHSAAPLIILGKGQGTFKTGRYIRGKAPDLGSGAGYKEAGADMAKVLVTMMQYMGMTDVKTVGTTGVDGPLTSLLA
jgi:hypothetical protein